MNDWRPTAELRWNLSPTPGEMPILQQKWIKQHVEGWREPKEDWRDAPSGYYPRL